MSVFLRLEAPLAGGSEACSINTLGWTNGQDPSFMILTAMAQGGETEAQKSYRDSTGSHSEIESGPRSPSSHSCPPNAIFPFNDTCEMYGQSSRSGPLWYPLRFSREPSTGPGLRLLHFADSPGRKEGRKALLGPGWRLQRHS